MSDFGKEVAKEIRDLQEHFAKKPLAPPGAPPVPGHSVDKAVAEQVNADLDGLAKKHEGG